MAILPGQSRLVGFDGGAAGGAPVSYVDEGAKVSSTANPSVATITSTGEKTIVFFACKWTSSPSRTINSATLDGNAMIELVNVTSGSAGSWIACAVYILNGAFTAKTLSVALSASPADCHVGVMSLSDLASETPVDTDVEGGTGAAAALAALTLWTADGITLGFAANDGSGSAFTWTNASELVDTNAGAFQFSYTADLNHDPAGTVKAAGASDQHSSVGVTLR